MNTAQSKYRSILTAVVDSQNKKKQYTCRDNFATSAISV